jgi:hypothetical protein
MLGSINGFFDDATIIIVQDGNKPPAFGSTLFATGAGKFKAGEF